MGQLVVNLQGLQEGYNDMLAFQDFLRDARPMTFNVTGKPNTLNAATAIWSGAASETRALVRTVNFQQGKPITKRVNAFGKGFSLQFGPRGRSWWLTPDGKIEEIVNKSKQ